MNYHNLKLIYFIGFLLSMYILSSCLEDAECETESSSEFKLSFNQFENGALDTVAFRSVTISSIPDSVFRTLEDTVSNILSFPVDPVNDSVSLAFVADNGVDIDTLVLGYTVTARLISPDCGAEQIYSDLKILRSDFDSTAVVNSLLDDETENNIQVFID